MIDLTILISELDQDATSYQVLVSEPESTAWRVKHTVNWSAIAGEKRVLQRALARAIQNQGTLERVRLTGQFLFDLVFPEEVKSVLRAHKGQLRLGTDAVELPWHLLHDGHRFLGENWAIGTVQDRQSLTTLSAPTAYDSRALVIADPACDLPAARFEGESVMAALSQLGSRLTSDVRFGPVRKLEFIKSFKGQRILHFAGHFDVEREQILGWRFSDGHIGPTELRALRGGSSPELFFSNACRASAAADFKMLVELGVENYVAPIIDVPDLASADFSRLFYDALGQGDTVGDALRQATWQGVASGDLVGLGYRLFGSPGRRYFRHGADQASPLRNRHVSFVYARLGGDSSHDLSRGLRSLVETVVAKHGGRVLPGQTTVVRAAFGLDATGEDDRLRALNVAAEVFQQMMQSTVLVLDGQAQTDGEDATGSCLTLAESQIWQLDKGMFGGGSLPRWSHGLVNAQPTNIEGIFRLIPSPESVVKNYSVFVGRKFELAELQRLSAECAQRRQARVASITGSAGIGKSRLVSAFLEVNRKNYRAVVVEAPSYMGKSFWQILSAIVVTLLVDSYDRDAQLTPESLKDRLIDIDRETDGVDGSVDLLTIDDLLSEPTFTVGLEQYASTLSTLAGLMAPEAPLSTDTLIQATSALLRRLSRQTPICVVIEGMARLEQSIQASVRQLIDVLQETPIFFITTSRKNQVLKEDWIGSNLLLKPMGDDDARMLLNQSVVDLPSSTSKAIIKRAQGNPLFLIQLAHSVVDGQLGTIPASIEIVFASRLDALDEIEQICLRIASVIGRKFRAVDVENLKTHTVALGVYLDRLVELKCLRRLPDGYYEFTHQLFAEVVYRSISLSQAQAWHGRIALALIEHGSTNTGRELLEIAHQFHASGDEDRGTEYAMRAAVHFHNLGDAMSARNALMNIDETACERFPSVGLDRARFFVVLAKVEVLLGNLAKGIELYRKSIDFSQKGTRLWGESFLGLSEALSASGQVEEAVQTLAHAVSLAREGEVERKKLVDLLLLKGWEEYKLGRVEAGIASVESARVLGGSSGGEPVATIENFFGVVALFKGELESAERHLMCARQRSEDSMDLLFRSRLSNNLGILFHRKGDYKKAVSAFEFVIRCHQELGDRLSLARVYNNLGSLYGDMGHFIKAERFFRETIRIREASKHSGLALAKTNLASTLYYMGRYEEARIQLDDAIAALPDGKMPSFMESGLLRYDGLLCIVEGRFERAQERLQASLDAAVKFAGVEQQFEAEMSLALLDLKTKSLTEAQHRLLRALDRVDATKHRRLIGKYFLFWAEHLQTEAPEESLIYRQWSVALTSGESL